MLECSPALGQKREAALAEAARRAQQRIPGPRVNVQAARAAGHRRAWEAGAAPEPGTELRIDFDATISIAFSEKQNAAATWKKTFGSTRW
jgi:hypothetical protein